MEAAQDGGQRDGREWMLGRWWLRLGWRLGVGWWTQGEVDGKWAGRWIARKMDGC